MDIDPNNLNNQNNMNNPNAMLNILNGFNMGNSNFQMIPGGGLRFVFGNNMMQQRNLYSLTY